MTVWIKGRGGWFTETPYGRVALKRDANGVWWAAHGDVISFSSSGTARGSILALGGRLGLYDDPTAGYVLALDAPKGVRR
jgi:hypothetical protein